MRVPIMVWGEPRPPWPHSIIWFGAFTRKLHGKRAVHALSPAPAPSPGRPPRENRRLGRQLNGAASRGKSAVMPADASSSGARPLGAAHGAALVVAGMIGTGVFTTTGVLLGSLHSAPMVLAVWVARSEEHTSELQSQSKLVCRLL